MEPLQGTPPQTPATVPMDGHPARMDKGMPSCGGGGSGGNSGGGGGSSGSSSSSGIRGSKPH